MVQKEPSHKSANDHSAYTKDFSNIGYFKLAVPELHREEYNRSDALSERSIFYNDQSLVGLVAFGLESINTNAGVTFAQREFT